jgi:signal transduction histidine kinase
MHGSHEVLIIADDADFTRDLVGRWQLERTVPGLTVMSTELLRDAGDGRFDLAIVGPVRQGRLPSVLKTVKIADTGVPILCVLQTAAQVQAAKAHHPRLLVMQRHEAWVDSLLLLATECLKRVDWTVRARKAEQAAQVHARCVALGRYMLENRHDFNNLLTSLLGNAELLLMDDASVLPGLVREQIETIHEMALHIHEIMRRFSSVANEMQMVEKQSQDETTSLSHAHGASS